MSPARRLLRPKVAVPVGLVVLALLAGVPATLAASRQDPPVRLAGIPETSDGDVTARIVGVSPTATVEVTLDRVPIRPVPEPTGLMLRLTDLADGEHVLVVRRPGRLLEPASTAEQTFTVDTTPPVLRVAALPKTVGIRDPLDVHGTTEPGAVVTADGRPVDVAADGSFTARWPVPPSDGLLVAVDAVGNRVEQKVSVAVRHPGMRAVHMSALSWTARSLREPVLKLIREKRIDTVELDIKDEDGEVGYASAVPLARAVGASKGYYDLRKTTAYLHSLGVRVVGRLVCFRDPLLARYAERTGKRDWLVQAPDGSAYKGYGGFTNPANDAVRQYQIDLGVEAVKGGFDDVLYDYVRRPDGPISTMRFPGLRGSPSDAVAEFVHLSRNAIRPAGGYVGVSVFGVASTRPTEVAQNIPRLAQFADYIAPMVYPSHWARGEYGVADPNGSPYDIVRRSLVDFRKAVRGTNSVVIPWLQDFSLGRSYGPAEVAAQIRATHDNGLDSFILWDPSVTYTAAALTPQR